MVSTVNTTASLKVISTYLLWQGDYLKIDFWPLKCFKIKILFILIRILMCA